MKLTPPNGEQTGDVNLSWDSTRNRFVFALLDLESTNIWYGYSTDATGTAWVFGNQNGSGVAQPVFTLSEWDYPSIGVDASGRVIIGAVNFLTSPVSYSTALSTDGQHFSAPGEVPTISGTAPQSRVAAAGSTFQVFVPTLNGSNLLTAINRYQSSNGVTWSGANLVMSFAAPLNSAQPSGSSYQIFYAPLLSAAGFTDGRWIVGWQENISGWNNVEICTSDRGCGTVNQAADDQFLAGVSVNSDGYWVAYHAYPNLNDRALPLITQAIYFPTSGAAVGATSNTGINPTAWILDGSVGPSRCSSPCYGGGDFNTPSQNPFAASNTTFVNASSSQTDLFNSFQEDPQATTANVPNFVPNFISHAMGEDLTQLAGPVPAGASSIALPPYQTRGFTIH